MLVRINNLTITCLTSVKQKGRSSLSPSQDLVPMIHNQSEYIQHLEAEVKFCKVYSHTNDFHSVFGVLFYISANLDTSHCITLGRAARDETADQSSGGGE